MTVQAYNYCC